jgi:hypothetical protein
MKINNRSTLAFAVALLLGAGTASAAGTLDLTIQVLDMSTMEPVSQLDIPDDISTDQVEVVDVDSNSNDDHGKAVSQVAKGLKASHDSETVHDTLVSVASDKNNGHVHADAADAAEAAKENAADAADDAKDNVADAAEAAAEAAKEASDTLKDSVDDATADMVMLEVTL